MPYVLAWQWAVAEFTGSAQFIAVYLAQQTISEPLARKSHDRFAIKCDETLLRVLQFCQVLLHAA